MTDGRRPDRPGLQALTTTLVTGPVRSGKSRHAEELLRGEADVTYVATGRPLEPSVPSVPSVPSDPADASDPVAPPAPPDAEWSRRVESHRVRRPSTWRTVETTDLAGVIASATGPLLIDCLGTWLTAVVDTTGWDDLAAAEAVVRSAADELVEALCAATTPIVVVTNEVGWSLVPLTAAGRFFQDELGRLNAAVSAAAAAVHLVVAGRVLDLSGAPVVAGRLSPRTPDA
ncbi:adenosylcobinamide kinase [Intrasporangium oryzae NRRL B-24470]|uniref:Adenosylcobinamide kinase n=1 Tax=Intrasporangium oryzae NRRL B-24470 TaxID=1386089 RepID=W9G5K8_9MICO|nr:bifunctional adenosylcobinamide kinase/adenosylcobinamide-phosphate guanylyltransferase [Intrasporangium oryzae]EWT00587.1 adenosylcobinamide kinase [Intrasporangium oryzae NRRL B-24470]